MNTRAIGLIKQSICLINSPSQHVHMVKSWKLVEILLAPAKDKVVLIVFDLNSRLFSGNYLFASICALTTGKRRENNVVWAEMEKVSKFYFHDCVMNCGNWYEFYGRNLLWRKRISVLLCSPWNSQHKSPPRLSRCWASPK